MGSGRVASKASATVNLGAYYGLLSAALFGASTPAAKGIARFRFAAIDRRAAPTSAQVSDSPSSRDAGKSISQLSGAALLSLPSNA